MMKRWMLTGFEQQPNNSDFTGSTRKLLAFSWRAMFMP
jgi:hypothetical protein